MAGEQTTTTEGQDPKPDPTPPQPDPKPTKEGLLAGAKDDEGEGDPKPDEGTDPRPAGPWHASPERPEWLPEQFWNAEAPEGERLRAEEFAKSWKDLRYQASRSKPEVPEKPDGYELELPEGATLEADDPVLSGAREAAHKAGLSKEQFQQFTQEFLEHAQKLAPEPIDTEAEKALLGEHADRIIGGVAGWGKNLVKLGVWSPDDFEEIVELGSTARGIAALNKLRVHYTREAAIPTQALDDGGLPSKEELYAAVGSDEYQKDPAYRAKIDKQFRLVFGDRPAGTSERSLGIG